MSIRDEALRYLGYRGQPLDDTIIKQIDKNISFLEEKVKPSYMYRIFDIHEENGHIHLKDTNITLVGNDINNHLKGASKCAVMASTLGFKAERILNNLSKTKISEAVIFDAVCTAKIEDVSDSCEEEIKNKVMRDGFYTNFRYSPGYGDFPLEYQKEIIKLLGCEKTMGLTVTDSSLLIPQKSVTAIIGIFKTEQNKKEKNCDTCSLKDKCDFSCKGEKSNGF